MKWASELKFEVIVGEGMETRVSVLKQDQQLHG